MATRLQIPHGRAIRSARLKRLIKQNSPETGLGLVRAVKEASVEKKSGSTLTVRDGRENRIRVVTTKKVV